MYVDDTVSIKGSRTSHLSWEDVTKVTPKSCHSKISLIWKKLINLKLCNLTHHIIQSRWHSPTSNVEFCVLFNVFNLKYSFVFDWKLYYSPSILKKLNNFKQSKTPVVWNVMIWHSWGRRRANCGAEPC